jgi:hypothetical protein
VKRGLVEPPRADHAGRVRALQERLRAAGAQLGLVYGDVSRSDDIEYLTGLCIYWNEGVVGVPADGEPALLSKLSKRVHPWMRATSTLTDLRSGRDLAALIAGFRAADAVRDRDDESAAPALDQRAILVLLADLSDIGRRTGVVSVHGLLET